MPRPPSGRPTKRAPSPPALRRRFVTSATYWRSQSVFLDALDREIDRWNEDFRLHPIRRGAAPMPDPPWRPGVPFPLPRSLQLVMDRSAVRQDRDPRVRPEDEEWMPSWFAWFWRLLDLSGRVWPPALFPNWTGTPYPPPIGFVAACLLWQPEEVEPEAWIPPITVQPLPHDPVGDPFAPAPIYWRSRYHLLVDQLVAALGTGAPITTEWVVAADSEAKLGAARVALPGALRPAPGGPVGFLALVPGMSVNDVRAATAAAKPLLDRGNAELKDLLPTCARGLHDEGTRKTDIAGRLGVHRDTVDRWLRAGARTSRPPT